MRIGVVFILAVLLFPISVRAENYCPAEIKWGEVETVMNFKDNKFQHYRSRYKKCSDNKYAQPGPDFIPSHKIEFLDHALPLKDESRSEKGVITCTYEKENAEGHVKSPLSSKKQAPQDAIVHCDSQVILRSEVKI